MRILTLGDSWTYGVNSSNPVTMSWPAQMARKYKVEVVNLARGGSSNQRATRIGIEELCRNSNYDYIILPLAPASRTEVLKLGKWQQIWPKLDSNLFNKFYAELWHPWNDVQNTIMLSFYFMHSVHALGIPLFITGLSLRPNQYTQELSWIMDYKNNNDFRSLNIPLADFNIGVNDLDRKLKSLKAIHLKNIELQPEYLQDVVESYFFLPETQKKYGYSYESFNGHPTDQGYAALADYFANKIGLI
jgi:lysophospholipase L1-like esterase